MRPTISVILPVYSESETLDKLKERLMPVLEERAMGKNSEIAVVIPTYKARNHICGGQVSHPEL